MRKAEITVIENYLGRGFQATQHLLQLFRSRQLDLTTPEGRSRFRYRRAVLSTMTALLAKGASMLMLLVSVPLTIGYLGNERYGIWVTVTSGIAFLSFADLGIGNGLVSELANAFGRNDYDALRKLVSSAFWMLVAVSSVIGAAAVLSWRFLNWNQLFGVHSQIAARETGLTFLVLLSCFIINLPIGIVTRIENGLQRGYVPNLWTAAGTFISLAGLLAAIRTKAGLPLLVLLFSLGPLAATLLNWLQLLNNYSWARPKLRLCTTGTIKNLFGTGLLFLAVQVSIAVAYQADNIVIAHFIGAGFVASYAVPARLFSIVTIGLSVLMAPLWPAYSESIARGDVDWMRRAFRRSCAISVGITLPLVLSLTFFGNVLLRIWVGGAVQASLTLLSLFAIRCLMSSYLYPATILLNGLGEMRFQAIMSILMGSSNIVLSIFLVRRVGINGAIAGTILSESVFLILPMMLRVRTVLKRTRSGGLEPCIPE